MRVVNTKTSNTVLASNKQLAEGSDEVSQAIETTSPGQAGLGSSSESYGDRSPSVCVSVRGISCSVLCRLF